MVSRRFFAHETPDGVDPAARMAAAGYPVDAVTTVEPQYTEVGVGVAHEAPKVAVEGPVGVYTTDFGGL